MKPGATRHYVLGDYRGRVSLVNTFPNPDLADALVSNLRERYGKHGAMFWRATSTGEHRLISWGTMRQKLRALEPMRMERPTSRPVISTRAVPPQPTTEEEITEFLARGSAVTILPAGRAKYAPRSRIAGKYRRPQRELVELKRRS